MSEPMYEIKAVYGSTEMPKPTGRWIIDTDGGIYQEMTPYKDLDMQGNIIKETPYEPFIKIYGMLPPGVLI